MAFQIWAPPYSLRKSSLSSTLNTSEKIGFIKTGSLSKNFLLNPGKSQMSFLYYLENNEGRSKSRDTLFVNIFYSIGWIVPFWKYLLMKGFWKALFPTPPLPPLFPLFIFPLIFMPLRSQPVSALPCQPSSQFPSPHFILCQPVKISNFKREIIMKEREREKLFFKALWCHLDKILLRPPLNWCRFLDHLHQLRVKCLLFRHLPAVLLSTAFSFSDRWLFCNEKLFSINGNKFSRQGKQFVFLASTTTRAEQPWQIFQIYQFWKLKKKFWNLILL